MYSKLERKEAIRKYKEQKTDRGAYAVRCTASGQVWVGSSPNLKAARNSSWFSLGNGSHRNRELQKEWDAYGASAFAFEELERLGDDVAALNLRDALKAVRERWATRLGARTLL